MHSLRDDDDDDNLAQLGLLNLAVWQKSRAPEQLIRRLARSWPNGRLAKFGWHVKDVPNLPMASGPDVIKGKAGGRARARDKRPRTLLLGGQVARSVVRSLV